MYELMHTKVYQTDSLYSGHVSAERSYKLNKFHIHDYYEEGERENLVIVV